MKKRTVDVRNIVVEDGIGRALSCIGLTLSGGGRRCDLNISKGLDGVLAPNDSRRDLSRLFGRHAGGQDGFDKLLLAGLDEQTLGLPVQVPGANEGIQYLARETERVLAGEDVPAGLEDDLGGDGLGSALLDALVDQVHPNVANEVRDDRALLRPGKIRDGKRFEKGGLAPLHRPESLDVRGQGEVHILGVQLGGDLQRFGLVQLAVFEALNQVWVRAVQHRFEGPGQSSGRSQLPQGRTRCLRSFLVISRKASAF